MAHFYIAHLPPQHYNAFRDILDAHIPNAYDEWRKFHVQKAANILYSGHTYVEVQIDPDEFARACDANRVERTLQGLDHFAGLKATSDTNELERAGLVELTTAVHRSLLIHAASRVRRMPIRKGGDLIEHCLRRRDLCAIGPGEIGADALVQQALETGDRIVESPHAIF